MRLTVFWERMHDVFGESYAESVARDVSLAALGGRTVHEALESGVPAKEVWTAVCEVFEVSAAQR